MIPRPVEMELHKLLSLKPNGKYLLAVSGGLDSVVLFHAFRALCKKIPFQWQVAYIHHGPGDSDTVSYRNRAYDFVNSLCEEHAVSFLSNVEDVDSVVGTVLTSEEDFRALRREQLSLLRKESGSDWVVLAHHREDLFETRLMRMIRGTGFEGLEGMSVEKDIWYRPFLGLNKQQLVSYAENLGLKWVEDPSNRDTQFFRNWIRQSWLPALEAYRPGSNQSFMSSLETIVGALPERTSYDFCFDGSGILRSEFIGLSLDEKRLVLAQFLKQSSFQDYGRSHVTELIKRLDVDQKDLTFRLLKKNWSANARHIWCD